MIARDVMVLGMVPVSRLLFSSRSLITQAHNNKAKDAFVKKNRHRGKKQASASRLSSVPAHGNALDA
jgi:hypothetical protein